LQLGPIIIWSTLMDIQKNKMSSRRLSWLAVAMGRTSGF
jgi:hypothetical protein